MIFLKNDGCYDIQETDESFWSPIEASVSFRLSSNDTKFANTTLDSPSVYMLPYGYPSSTFTAKLDGPCNFLSPQKEDMQDLSLGDTVVFQWQPELASGMNVTMRLASET